MVPLPSLTPPQQTVRIGMSPLLFLLIPIAVFAVGSTLLFAASRFSGSSHRQRNVPVDLRSAAPMLRDQRDAGWSVGSSQHTRR